jgi:hypothetical protein
VNGASAHITVTQRRLPGCDTGPWVRLGIDKDTLDFASTMLHRHGLVIARHVTVYPDARTAARFPGLMDRRLSMCPYGGRTPYAVEGGEFSSGRAYGLTGTPAGTLFSWGSVRTHGTSAIWIDVVARNDNAVAFTRVMNPDATSHDPDPLTNRAEHPALVAEARHQATVATHIVGGLG